MIGTLIDEQGRTNGILQMFNFNGPITGVHINRMKALSGFLGGCLANIHDINKSINTMIGIQMVMDGCNESLKVAERGVESNLADYRGIFVPIDAVKKLCEYMDNFHVSN